MEILGVILAGGVARRMGGGDKGLLDLGGRTLLEEVAARLAPQCGGLVLNANGDPARFAHLGWPVVPDGVPGLPGPLAGVLTGMEAAHTSHILTVPADTPFIPPNLAARLASADAPIAMASSGGRIHPTCALWSTRLRGPLRDALERGVRRVRGWADGQGAVEVPFDAMPHDPFFNVNTPADLEIARELARGRAVLPHPWAVRAAGGGAAS